jgi:hypothetical protein
MSPQHQIAFQDHRELLYHLDELVRTMPPGEELRNATPEHLDWIGRARALISAWEPTRSAEFVRNTEAIYARAPNAYQARQDSLACLARMLATIQEARSTLRIIYGARVSQSFASGQPFDVYDELRRQIETAQIDTFFVDRYMGADFVSRYLPSVRAGVSVRLLTRDLIPQLVAAVEAFVQQHHATVSIRTSQSIHGRFLSLDRGTRSFLIDASFKDAGAASPVALIELTDTAATSLAQYEALWQAGTVVRPP